MKGEITFAITDDVFDRVDAEYLVLDIDGILVPFYLEEYRFKNDENVLVKFEDIDTQEQARNYTGREVFFPRHLSDSDGENMTRGRNHRFSAGRCRKWKVGRYSGSC